MEKKLFIIDFDGTLLTDDRTVSEADMAALERLRQKNIVTAVATGRSVYSFEKALKMMGLTNGHSRLPVDYVIFSTGAGMMDFPGCSVIFQKSLSSGDVRQITAYFNRQCFDYMVHKSIPHTRQFLYKFHGHHNPDFLARLALYKESATCLKEGFWDFEPATEVLAILPGGVDGPCLEKIRTDLSGFSVIHATSPLDHKSAWIEVFHRQVSKAKTASRLAKRLGVSRENVISVGNDYNDQDLLAWSKKGYVVDNAPDSLKKRFETVASNNSCGVTRAIEKSGWLD